MEWLDRLREVFPVPLLLAILAGIWRWCKPRRVLSFLAAVKEREAALATTEYWKAEATRERESGLRWKAHYDQCQTEIHRLDGEAAALRTRLSARRESTGGGISTS